MAELEEQINVVVEVRGKTVIARGILQVLKKKWDAEVIIPVSNVDAAIKLQSVAEDKLRELVLKAYAETGDKAPAVGVGIRERTVLTYDNKIAFDWAKAHKMALKLDTSAFEKIAKVDPPDFVKITTEPQATIATELIKVN